VRAGAPGRVEHSRTVPPLPPSGYSPLRRERQNPTLESGSRPFGPSLREAPRWGVPGGHPPAVITGRRRRGHLATALMTRQTTIGPCPPPPFGVLPPPEGETEPDAALGGAGGSSPCNQPSRTVPPSPLRGTPPCGGRNRTGRESRGFESPPHLRPFVSGRAPRLEPSTFNLHHATWPEDIQWDPTTRDFYHPGTTTAGACPWPGRGDNRGAPRGRRWPAPPPPARSGQRRELPAEPDRPPPP